MTQPTRLYRFISLLTIPVVVAAIALMVDLALHPLEVSFGYQPFWSRWLYGFVFSAVNIVIGVLCTRRAPGNIIGPLLVIYGAGLTGESLRASFDPTLGAVIVFVGSSFGWIGFFVLVLLFPNGKPHPRWMRWFLGGLFFIFGLYVLLFPLGTAQFIYGADDAPSRLVENPFYSPAAAPIYQTYLNLMLVISLPAVVTVLPLSVLLRYRAGTRQERAQIRWILWGVLVFMLIAIVQRIIDTFGLSEVANLVGNGSALLVVTLPAFAIGNAILRYKLYDIDIIVRRTLVYSILTAILAIIYFGGVILVQQVLKPLTESSDLAIVISTLAIAALFTPLRRRVQNTIDRRFYRRKYDAQKTLEGFNATLRDAVDLDTLEGALVGVVQDTMQPTKVALWVRENVQKEAS